MTHPLSLMAEMEFRIRRLWAIVKCSDEIYANGRDTMREKIRVSFLVRGMGFREVFSMVL